MAYTETTTKSYGSRLSGSFKGIGTGIILIIAATVLLFWNEGRAVKTSKAIKEAASTAVHVDDVSTVDPALNGKLIHATAFADTKDTLRDNLFGANENAIRLSRTVEYYQYKENAQSETKEKIGGGTETVTTYTYTTEWVSDPVNSSEFKDPAYKNVNYILTKVEDYSTTAPNVTFGAYTLPEFIKGSISGYEPANLSMTEDQIKEWNQLIREQVRTLRSSMPQNDTTLGTAATNLIFSESYCHVRGNVVILGRNENNPQVGDVRITVEKVVPKDISLIAKVNGNTFERFVAKNGKEFSRVENGTVSMENMFEGAKKENTFLTWLLRIVGLLLVYCGFKSLFGILPMLLNWMPFLGKIAGVGTGILSGVLSFVWTLIVVAIAWLVYRPVLSIILLVIAAAGIVLLVRSSKKKKAAANNEVTPPATPTATKE